MKLRTRNNNNYYAIIIQSDYPEDVWLALRSSPLAVYAVKPSFRIPTFPYTSMLLCIVGDKKYCSLTCVQEHCSLTAGCTSNVCILYFLQIGGRQETTKHRRPNPTSPPTTHRFTPRTPSNASREARDYSNGRPRIVEIGKNVMHLSRSTGCCCFQYKSGCCLFDRSGF